MRVLLFTGKGGVGKSTLAAATAAHAAASGCRTLLISTDPAHSIPDLIDDAELLDTHLVDITARREASWHVIEQYLERLFVELGVDHVEAEALTNLPAVDDVLALLEVADHLRDVSYDVVVIDAPPTAETMRLLTLPEALATLLRKLGTTRAALARLVVDVPTPRPEVFVALESVIAELVELRALLTGPSTSLRVVTTADAVVLAETRRTVAALTLHGYRIDAVIANRVFTTDGADEWRAAWAERQEKQIALLAQELHGVPVLTAAYAQAEPVGCDELVRFARAVYADRDPSDILGVAPGHRWYPTDAGYEYVIPMPYTERAQVQCSRVDDDLIVEAGTARRAFALPAVLRRCTISHAAWKDGSLHIRFVPNPEVWPQS